MKFSRRTAAAIGCTSFIGLAVGTPRAWGDPQLEARLAQAGPVSGITKADLPTPALLLDLALFEQNVATMATHVSTHGKQLRPHAKTHKCPEIAHRQRAAGAIGVCVATVPEALVMARAGVKGILLASPIASPNKAKQLAKLVQEGGSLLVTVDHPDTVSMYQQAAEWADVELDVLVDLDVGDQRTGAVPDERALRLGEAVVAASRLRLRGLQAYSGGSSHVIGFKERSQHSQAALAAAAKMRHRFQQAGLPAEILSGASTGTYNIDSQLPELSELQCGSYAAMDAEYQQIGGVDGDVFTDFAPALSVLTSVVSVNHPGFVTVDAGFKASATDRPIVPQPKNLPSVSYRFRGDEFGILSWDAPQQVLHRGDRVELIPAHCDPTINLYDRIFACRGEQVEAIWSVMDRLQPYHMLGNAARKS